MQRVLQNQKLGVCYDVIGMDAISSSCGKANGDCFKLSIPYAKQNLDWNVLFNSLCPEMGPDFIFNDESFFSDIDIDKLQSDVPSLANWNANDKDALLNVLTELLSCYKQHQIELLSKQSRLELEYRVLVESTGIEISDVEIILLPLGGKPTEARFLINLTVDVSELPERSNSTDDCMAQLIVTFSGENWNRIQPELRFSKSLDNLLGVTSGLRVPPFPADKCLMDYVPEIRKFIEKKVNTVVENLNKKSLFISCVLLRQLEAVIEYDTVEFNFVSLLLDDKEFKYLVMIQLPTGFPEDRPLITLQSIYHQTPQQAMYSETLEDFPYRSKWQQDKMVDSILECLEVAVQKFKTNCIKNTT